MSIVGCAPQQLAMAIFCLVWQVSSLIEFVAVGLVKALLCCEKGTLEHTIKMYCNSIYKYNTF